MSGFSGVVLFFETEDGDVMNDDEYVQMFERSMTKADWLVLVLSCAAIVIGMAI